MISAKVLVSLALLGLAVAAPSNTINSKLSAVLAKGNANVFIRMREGSESALATISSVNFDNREARLNAVADTLREHAAQTQKNILSFLSKGAIEHTSFWIDNSVFIPNANKDLVDQLAKFSEIEELYEEHIMQLDDPIVHENDPTPRALQWGVQKIGADRTWARSDGTGIVVGGIDTGVRGTHVNLRGNFRGAYGWYDPSNRSASPNDSNGHGTHTMGTIAGSDGIGVAPGAQWVACKGCATSSCSQADLTACGQFMACPHDTNGQNPDCSRAPNLVSNSWGGGQGQTWYSPIVNSWVAAGIVPLFSQGNSGPGCNTANSPGDLATVIGVGSTTNTDAISSFSSKGPSGSRVKPDISAPGSTILSSWHTSDTATSTLSGTSMACPHAAGAVALILGVRPSASIADVKSILFNYASHAVVAGGQNCGGISESTFPNNAFGYGIIDVYASVQSMP